MVGPDGRIAFAAGVLVQALPGSLAAGLDELVGSGLASRRHELTDPVYTFKHALVQEAIYGSLLRRRRADIHAAIVAVAENDPFPEPEDCLKGVYFEEE